MVAPFDTQADAFDRRAGVPDDVARQIARVVGELAPLDQGGLLLEIGAGTGQIGCHLLKLPMRYVGLDLSGPMLERFRERLEPGSHDTALVQGDGNLRWPVDDRSVDVVFSSRALHLLDPRHVAGECFRVARRSGAVLLTGSVRRERDSIKSVMRRQMRTLLQGHGIEGRSGENKRQAVFQFCIQRGAMVFEPRDVSSWRVADSPAGSLRAWESKAGLAGVETPDDIKLDVLSELRQWAVERFGDLQRTLESADTYVLEGIRFPAGTGS